MLSTAELFVRRPVEGVMSLSEPSYRQRTARAGDELSTRHTSNPRAAVGSEGRSAP